MNLKGTTLGVLAAAAIAVPASAQEPLEAVGISVGLLGNPFFVATVNGIEAKAKEINPDVQITSVSADYELNKQFTQIDNFIAAGTQVVMINAVDPNAIAPAVQRAKAAGAIVAAFDVAAAGADVTVMTNNIKAGQEACQYIADKLGGEGDVIIINGPQVSSVVDRVTGCKEVFAQHPGINILSDNQDAKGSREGGLAVMQGLLTRYPEIDAVFAINDPTAIGAELAARQFGRSDFFITSVDGAPDIEQALKSGNSMIEASASQDPYVMAGRALDLAYQVLQGNPPAETTELLDPVLITADNVNDYQGWQAPR
ncbi:ABC transporter substrate-binding protein [Marinivivus vitaminiproducens]|uniref:ABC transporter substrate-binding protein n=1 Tax=Marinivivus vitaminiproducens TaxID=3035935 RepID=UPI0027A55088|nr:ABC transporter substrate-binding protein [Geminicoccaceae bacterium SCSIO 64248]